MLCLLYKNKKNVVMKTGPFKGFPQSLETWLKLVHSIIFGKPTKFNLLDLKIEYFKPNFTIFYPSKTFAQNYPLEAQNLILFL